MTTAAVPTAPARARAVPAAVKRPGLPGTLRSELVKIRSVRSTYWTLLAQVVASIAWAVLNCAGIVSHGHGPDFNAAEASLTGQVEHHQQPTRLHRRRLHPATDHGPTGHNAPGQHDR